MARIAKLTISTCAGLASLALASPADAVVIVTYKGVVTSGFDVDGVFGSALRDLTGINFTVVYTIDDANPLAYSEKSASYGTTYGSYEANPVVATLTIDGISDVIGRDHGYVHGSALQYNQFLGVDRVFHAAEHADEFGFGYDAARIMNDISSSTADFVSSGDFTQNLSFTPSLHDSVVGYAERFRYRNFGGTEYAYSMNLRNTSVSIANAVPEPATWAMMIAGFGAIGVAMRRSPPRLSPRAA